MVKDFAELINVPQAYFTKLLLELAKENGISSTRGSNGWFYLNTDNEN